MRNKSKQTRMLSQVVALGHKTKENENTDRNISTRTPPGM